MTAKKTDYEEIMETLGTPGWKLIEERLKVALQNAEREIIAPRQSNPGQVLPKGFDEYGRFDWIGVRLGIKYFINSTLITLNRKYSPERISLWRGFHRGLREVFQFIIRTKNIKESRKLTKIYREAEQRRSDNLEV